MYPPQSPTTLDIDALSGVCGSISIACWVVVFSPQIIENFRRSSAEGLSIVFLVVWLLGDIFNILGAVLQGVLPTMIILAVYYTLADIVLLLQVFYYRGFTLKDEVKKPAGDEQPDNERQPLLLASSPNPDGQQRRSFSENFHQQGQHFSPATPLHDANRNSQAHASKKPYSLAQTIAFDTAAVLVVCAAGALGWWISSRGTKKHHHKHYNKHNSEPAERPQFDTLGQFFGYLCAIFYLASRIPQLLLNYRRKSTEGVSLLFFLFACIGNLTYDMSIFAYNPEHSCRHGPSRCEPGEARAIYARYIAVNASWIAGSLGTLFLDCAIFVQFFLYKKDDDNNTENRQTNGHAMPEHAIQD